MKYGGLSLTGSYHAYNQDNYAARKVAGGYVLAVSDGLGSKKYSKAGSAALCAAACDAADAISCNVTDAGEYIRAVHALWIATLSENHLEPDVCRATALIGIIGKKKLWLFRLGDGFIGAVFDDDVLVLFDDKKDRFANETECLGGEPDVENWAVQHAAFASFRGIVAGTDGLALANDETRLKKFTADFCANYERMNISTTLADIGRWLPKCKGIDDRTVAFVMQDERKEVP